MLLTIAMLISSLFELRQLSAALGVQDHIVTQEINNFPGNIRDATYAILRTWRSGFKDKKEAMKAMRRALTFIRRQDILGCLE